MDWRPIPDFASASPRTFDPAGAIVGSLQVINDGDIVRYEVTFLSYGDEKTVTGAERRPFFDSTFDDISAKLIKKHLL